MRSRNHCCRGKVTSIKYYERVSVALVTQHAMLIGRNVLSFVTYVPATSFAHYLVNGVILGKNLTDKKMSVWISSIIFVSNIPIVRRIQRDIIINFN
jgi:hypothetical protein